MWWLVILRRALPPWGAGGCAGAQLETADMCFPSHGAGSTGLPAHSRDAHSMGTVNRDSARRCRARAPACVVLWTHVTGTLPDARPSAHAPRDNLTTRSFTAWSPCRSRVARLPFLLLPDLYTGGASGNRLAGSISHHGTTTVQPVYDIRCRRPPRYDSPPACVA